MPSDTPDSVLPESTPRAALQLRYLRAAHRVQTAVSYNPDRSGREPHHLRMGVNVAMADLGSLARLLISKGLITEEELAEALAVGMELEASQHEAHLNQALGVANIKTI